MALRDRLARVGQEWSFDANVEVIKERRRADNDARRYKIAIAVLGAIGVGVVGLGAWGLYGNDFNAVSSFWIGAGPVAGTVIGYYFGKAGDDP